MAKYRRALPQLNGVSCLTDGGLETTLVFLDGRELPEFAAFPLLATTEGRERLRAYYADFIAIARTHRVGFVIETPTWRASADYGERLGFPREHLRAVIRMAVQEAVALRQKFETQDTPIVISGTIGPRRDGYAPDTAMTAAEAADYHSDQIRTFSETAADLVSAATLTNTAEAVGIVNAAQKHGIPVAVSFTVETDGNLPSGESLADAIAAVDDYTAGGPVYYGINCAHPTHFDFVMNRGGDWLGRVRAIEANASCMSHAELDNATDLDRGDPAELGRQVAALRARFPHITVLGGCCGTDPDHIHHVAANLVAAKAA